MELFPKLREPGQCGPCGVGQLVTLGAWRGRSCRGSGSALPCLLHRSLCALAAFAISGDLLGHGPIELALLAVACDQGVQPAWGVVDGLALNAQLSSEFVQQLLLDSGRCGAHRLQHRLMPNLVQLARDLQSRSRLTASLCRGFPRGISRGTTTTGWGWWGS